MVLLSGLACSSQAGRLDSAAAFQAFGEVGAKVGVLVGIDRSDDTLAFG